MTHETIVNAGSGLPQETDLKFFLGGMSEQLNGISRRQEQESIIAATSRAETKAELAAIHANQDTLKDRVTLLETKQKPRTPWYSIVGAVASIVTGIGGFIALFVVLSRLATIMP